jgi:hypothetical protein
MDFLARCFDRLTLKGRRKQTHEELLNPQFLRRHSYDPTSILRTEPSLETINALLPKLLLHKLGRRGIIACLQPTGNDWSSYVSTSSSFPLASTHPNVTLWQPQNFFQHPEAVGSEYNRMSDYRDLLRTEEVLTAVKFRSDPRNARSWNLALLVARACRCIQELQQGCRDHGLVLDFYGIDDKRRASLPSTHPYKILLKYLDLNSGPDHLADFHEYYGLEWGAEEHGVDASEGYSDDEQDSACSFVLEEFQI